MHTGTGLRVVLAAALALLGLISTLTPGEAREPSASPSPASRAPAPGGDPLAGPFRYPAAAMGDQKDDYHGTVVADPYRWLEDLDSAATRAWVSAESELTSSVLARIPQRSAIKERLTQLWNYEKFGVPFRAGNRYFYTRNDGLQNQSVLYTVSVPPAGGSARVAPRVLLDPNLLSKDGTVALSGYAPSEDGKKLAYAISRSGSDWAEWHVRDVESGQDLADRLDWVKFSGASWTHDHQGFFYSRYDEPRPGASMKETNYYQKLYYHRLGTPQAEDRLVYERKDEKEWQFSGTVTDDGRYLVITVHVGTDPRNRVYYQDLKTPGAPVVKLIDRFEASWHLVDSAGPVFWFRTDLAAPRYRVMAIDTRQPEPSAWKELIPQGQGTLQQVSVVADTFVASYLEDACARVRLYSLEGRFLKNLPLPGLGTVWGFSGRREYRESFYGFMSFTTPPTIYRHDFDSGKSDVYRQPRVGVDPSRYEVKQVFFRSKDGTRVPMFIVHAKGMALDGNNPTLLYGYGGFNIPLTPSFSVSNAVWMEMGGVYVMANLRGGGEYGEAWHQAGTKLHKQNVFDDFIAAAEWLIANRYTRPARLAIRGGSNGGLLVGAVMTQRPELFGAALPAVGVMDMLRFQKFTVGWGWVSDYGSSDDPEQFKALYAYSPLHRLRAGVAYPPTLVTTADHDDRVFPAHSFKFAAALQAAQGGPAPVLIRIEQKAGHGAGKPTTKIIDETADVWAFLAAALKMPAPKPAPHR